MSVCMSVRTLETSKMMGFGWNFTHLFLVCFFHLLNYFLGPRDEFLYQNKVKPLEQPGESKYGRIWLKFRTHESSTHQTQCGEHVRLFLIDFIISKLRCGIGHWYRMPTWRIWFNSECWSFLLMLTLGKSASTVNYFVKMDSP